MPQEEWASWWDRVQAASSDVLDDQSTIQEAKESAQADSAALNAFSVAAEQISSAVAPTATKTVDVQTGAVMLTYGVPKGEQDLHVDGNTLVIGTVMAST